MIITKEITIKVNPKLVNYYKNLGYNINGCEIITIPVEHLPKKSSIKIEVKCDICGLEKKLNYVSYNRNINKYPIYACCEKCANIKREMTCLEKYGVKYNKDRNEFEEMSKKIKLEKYGDVNYTNRNKYKQTCMEKYGCINSFQVEEFKEKSKETKIEKYNDINFTNPLKTIQTKIEKYNDPYYNNSEKTKLTNMSRYGVSSVLSIPHIKESNSIKTKKWFNDNPQEIEKRRLWMSSQDFKEKSSKTIWKKYGVTSTMHVPSIVIKNHKSGFWIKRYKDTDLYYRGSYELDFLYNYYDRLKIETIKGIKYQINNKEHYYFSDFYLPDFNLIVEIKSNYTYNVDLYKNLAKEKYSINSGYNFLFIIDKDYEKLNSLIK